MIPVRDKPEHCIADQPATLAASGRDGMVHNDFRSTPSRALDWIGLGKARHTMKPR